jgi:hypothetical protein
VAPTAATTGTITAASLTATVTVAPKPYDGTLSATLVSCTLSGVVGGDDVHCTGGYGDIRQRERGEREAGDGERRTLTGAAAGTTRWRRRRRTTGTITAASLTAR